MYIFLDQRKTYGNRTTFEAIMAIKAIFKLDLKIRYEITNAATPSATFKP
jgi:hypothetical protein